MKKNSVFSILFQRSFVSCRQRSFLSCYVKFAIANTDESCYPIFLDFYTQILEILGYHIDITLKRANLTHSTAKKLVQQTIEAYRGYVDYEIKFCEKLYL